MRDVSSLGHHTVLHQVVDLVAVLLSVGETPGWDIILLWDTSSQHCLLTQQVQHFTEGQVILCPVQLLLLPVDLVLLHDSLVHH